MKKQRLLAFVLSLLVFTACEKNDELIDNSIEGIYTGTISFDNKLKSITDGENEGTAIVIKVGEAEIQVHCFGGELDTTFMLGYYVHNDSILVCLTGETFQNHYDHMLGQGHMMDGGMMGHSNNNETPWAHHLNDEHQEGDEHFGGFYMENHSFNYAIETEHGYYHFNGQKQ